MPTVFLSPLNETTFFIPGGNTPANGAQLFVYQAGSSTKVTVYKDNGGAVAWTNPIVLDSGGSPPSNKLIWIPSGTSVDLVLAPSTDTDPPASPYWTKEDLSGVNDVTTQEWTSGPTPTFVNSSSFTLSGDQTATFKSSRRLKFTVTAGTVYGAIANAAVSNGSTTVNTVFSSGSLDSGLTAVSYSLVDSNPSSINADYISKKATAVPSAGNGTTNIWGVDGDYVHVTGTNTIASFSSAPYAGAKRELIFDGALQITHGGNLLVQGSANVTTAANDRATVRADTTSSAVITMYTRNTGVPVVAPQGSSTVFAGPISGASTAPSFRALTAQDGFSKVFIASTAAVASSSIDTPALTGFAAYEIQLQNMLPNTTVALWMKVSTNNAVTFENSSNYSFSGINFPVGGAVAGAGSNSDGKFVLASVSASTGVNGHNGSLTMQNFSAGLSFATWDLIGINEASANLYNSGGGRYAGAVSGLRFMPSTGLISGTIYVYGVRAP